MVATPDAFISHASEDKDTFVRPLAAALRERGVDIWLDEWELQVGDSLVEKISTGLNTARFGIVVLSPRFFDKQWPRRELDALAALETTRGRDVLLPIWLDLGIEQIAASAPLLLARVALKASEGVDNVAEKLATKIRGRADAPSVISQPTPRTLSAEVLRAYALPSSYAQPVNSDERAFLVRTALALHMPLDRDSFLSSAHKNAFQAIVADSGAETLVQHLVDAFHPLSATSWHQAQPNSGIVATIKRDAQRMQGRGGSVEAAAGVALQTYMVGQHGYAFLHLDVVLRLPEDPQGGSLLSLDDLYDLLAVPAAALRDQVAPVIGAMIAGDEEPEVSAHTIVAMPQQGSFDDYLNLMTWAGDRVPDARGPHAVHWEARSTADFANPEAWRATVLRMLERLFSDGSYIDYEQSLQQLGMRRS